jgi:hypothetical protein
VDASEPGAIDAQTAQRLAADVLQQLAAAPALTLALSTPWRVLGLFPSNCRVCRVPGVCGAASCAQQVCGCVWGCLCVCGGGGCVGVCG